MGKLADSFIKLRKARVILDCGIFDDADWTRCYGAKFTREQLWDARKFPWSEDVLCSICPLCGKTVKDCHFAFLGLDRLNGKPLSILKLEELHPATATVLPRFATRNIKTRYSEEKFAKETTMDFRWYFLHRDIVPKSEDKDCEEQMTMLPQDYEVPSAITEVTKCLLVFRKTRKFVNYLRYARCECVTSGGHHINIGNFDEVGLDINDYRISNRCHYPIGIAASRKLPVS